MACTAVAERSAKAVAKDCIMCYIVAYIIIVHNIMAMEYHSIADLKLMASGS